MFLNVLVYISCQLTNSNLIFQNSNLIFQSVGRKFGAQMVIILSRFGPRWKIGDIWIMTPGRDIIGVQFPSNTKETHISI